MSVPQNKAKTVENRSPTVLNLMFRRFRKEDRLSSMQLSNPMRMLALKKIALLAFLKSGRQLLRISKYSHVPFWDGDEPVQDQDNKCTHDYPDNNQQDRTQCLHQVRALVAHDSEVFINHLFSVFTLCKREQGINHSINGYQVKTRDLSNKLEQEEGIVWELQIEQSHQDDNLEGVDRSPQHLDGR